MAGQNMQEHQEHQEHQKHAEAAAGNGKPFEENMTRLEALVRQLERGELSLEEALVCYQEGVALVRYCQQSLERTAKEVELLTEGMTKEA